jgi:hypothetical protein
MRRNRFLPVEVLTANQFSSSIQNSTNRHQHNQPKESESDFEEVFEVKQNPKKNKKKKLLAGGRKRTRSDTSQQSDEDNRPDETDIMEIRHEIHDEEEDGLPPKKKLQIYD